METLEDLKAIITGKPSDGLATHIDEDGDYVKSGELVDSYFNGHKWVDMNNSICTRSLSDIERIIELMERVKSGYEAYTRIEAIKQRYNGESKYKTNLLIDAEILLRSREKGKCDNLADIIKEALK